MILEPKLKLKIGKIFANREGKFNGGGESVSNIFEAQAVLPSIFFDAL
jgi:hypothetical protein